MNVHGCFRQFLRILLTPKTAIHYEVCTVCVYPFSKLTPFPRKFLASIEISEDRAAILRSKKDTNYSSFKFYKMISRFRKLRFKAKLSNSSEEKKEKKALIE